MKFQVCELIAFRDGNDPVHVCKQCNIFCGKTGFVTDYADDRNLFALGQMCGQTVCFNILCDSLYIFIRCLRFHYNDHK